MSSGQVAGTLEITSPDGSKRTVAFSGRVVAGNSTVTIHSGESPQEDQNHGDYALDHDPQRPV